MSTTTVAGAVLPPEPGPVLTPSRPERFQPSDFVAAGIVLAITMGLYICTLAPNVTLEDSGELITAAAKFGVGHPPGYPLWTMAGFALSHLFPFGNLAWRVNLLCAIIGGFSNAVVTLLVCHSGRWLLQRWVDPAAQAFLRPFCFYAGIASGLIIGFSDVMWGQAVISAVHGTLNALFVNLVLLLFYLWMLEPQKTHRLIWAVFVFALGLTNHHTLIQIIPAMLIAALVLRAGKFWSVFLSINLFSLSILVYVSWLAVDNGAPDVQLHRISEAMAFFIIAGTAVIAFFYLREFRLRPFLGGVAAACALFAYGNYFLSATQFDNSRILHPGAHFWLWGNYVHPGWLQITTGHGWVMLFLTALALGLLFTSTLDRRMVIGVFCAGWVGLVPYAYESFASSTYPPMNWGYAKQRDGFYYAVSRQQYPESLPNLIKNTIGKAVGVIPRAAQTDVALGRPQYGHRLWLTFYYYVENFAEDITPPLLFVALALLLYLRRCDVAQVNWLIFLLFAFFFLAFMLNLIEPQESFDFERNLQYKVFQVQSHCIYAMFIGYGILAVLAYFRETRPELFATPATVALGPALLLLSLLPLTSNAARCNQAGHWFGWMFGHDIMAPMDPAAVYYGGSDPGRFVPTYMAFVESQQDNAWKRDPGFDRRDVTVLTQNALCDGYYAHYIRDQYDPRYRPTPQDFTPFERWLGRDQAYPKIPVTCVSDKELDACWDIYRKEHAERIRETGQVLRPGTTDVFEINGVVAQAIFEKNKAAHTFYLEQSVPIDWMYPYLLPSGLIFKLAPEPLKTLPPEAIAADRKYWDDYAARLLADPNFSVDDHATDVFSKLAFWHADLYRYRNLPLEEEHWLRLAVALCPQQQDSIQMLTHLLVDQSRFDEAITLLRQAEQDDPRNEFFPSLEAWVELGKTLGAHEADVRAKLGKTPKSAYDVNLNLELARVLQQEGKQDELDDRLRFAAGLTNWDRAGMAGVVQYYVDEVHEPSAAIAFLEARAKIEPHASEMIYSLAALHASIGQTDDALKYLRQAIASGGTNAATSARIDPRFESLHDDPRFRALVMPNATNAPPAATPVNAPPVKPAPPRRASDPPK
jgi:tetratricopeptide (TPR) repeat protein